MVIERDHTERRPRRPLYACAYKAALDSRRLIFVTCYVPNRLIGDLGAESAHAPKPRKLANLFWRAAMPAATLTPPAQGVSSPPRTFKGNFKGVFDSSSGRARPAPSGVPPSHPAPAYRPVYKG